MSEAEDIHDQVRLRDSWTKALVAYVKADVWGQVVEAIEGYENLTMSIRTYNGKATASDKLLLHRLVSVISARCETLISETPDGFPSKEDMNKLAPSLLYLFKPNTQNDFPLDLSILPNYLEEDFESKLSELESTILVNKGLLMPRPVALNGERFVSFQIASIGIKDAETFEAPVFKISVLDTKGNLLEPKQETPVAEKQLRYRVDFNSVVHIQTPISQLEGADAAIFIEFAHFKSKKKKLSTKCWSLLEIDELTTGEKLLEIYMKPVEKTRRKLKLFSQKKLYTRIKLVVE